MTRDEEKDPQLEALLEQMGASGRFPLSEETLERAWSRIDPARLSPAFRAQVHAALDEHAVPNERRRVGAEFAALRSSAGLERAELARRLAVSLAELEGVEAGRTHPAALQPDFWLTFADILSVPRRELARLLASTAGLIAGAFTPASTAAWVADLDLEPTASPAEAEAALRERLTAILIELERD